MTPRKTPARKGRKAAREESEEEEMEEGEEGGGEPATKALRQPRAASLKVAKYSECFVPLLDAKFP